MTTTSGRLLRLLSLLQSRPYWGGPELAGRLGVTTRTVRRDVARLRDLGYPVDAAPGEAGGYRLGNGGDLPPLLLDDDEATAVTVALAVSTGGAVRGIEEPALAALAKLDRLLPPRLRHRVDALRAATVALAGPAGDPVDADALVALAQSCDGNERVVLSYRDREGRPSERRVEPYRLVSTGRRWYLHGFDLDRADWRTFRVDRIGDLRRTGHRFTPDPAAPDAAVAVSEGISSAPYRYQAVVVFPRTSVEQLSALVPATVGAVRPHGRRGSILATGADRLESLAGHLVGLGLDFTVREPVELRRHLAQVAARLDRATG